MNARTKIELEPITHVYVTGGPHICEEGRLIGTLSAKGFKPIERCRTLSADVLRAIAAEVDQLQETE